MINQAAIKKFLSKPTDSFDWLKAETGARLDAALQELKPPMHFGTVQPWDHQKACLLLLIELKRFMLHADMGAGKTIITLLLIKYRKLRGEKPKAIVFVPYITTVSTWIDEVALHTPELTCVPLLGTTAENLEQLQTAKGDLFVICYQSAVAMVTDTVASKKPGKMQWQLTPDKVRKYFSRFDMLVMDEIHKAKSLDSLTYRMCRAISANCDWALGLTGTPFNKDLADLWPQFYLIDFGETLGPTLGFYREVFFNKIKNFAAKSNYAFNYKFKKKLLPDLKRIIKNRSISYAIEDIRDMPPKSYVIEKIRPDVGQYGYAKAAMDKIKQAVMDGGTTTYRVVESNYLQLRQLASGFMTLQGENNDRLQIQFDKNPKLEALLEMIDAMPDNRKMIVFHHFVYTNKMLSEALTKIKVGHARVYSGVRDPIAELRRFKADPKCSVLLLNDQSGSSGLNLQFANYLVFFEQPDSSITRQQAERRVWRPGQVRRTFIYDLLMRDTYDERIHKSNKLGESLLKTLLRGG